MAEQASGRDWETKSGSRRESLPKSARTGRLSDLAAVYGLAIVFVLVMIVFGLLRPESFFSSMNINTVLVGQSVTAMLALAEMGPLATRQFDLSVGFHLGMAQVLIVGLQVQNGQPWPLAAAIVLLVAVLIGALNGLLVTRFGIDSFIATMGVGTLLYGISNWYSGGAQITGSNLPASFTGLSDIFWHVPLPAVYVAVAAVALWVVTERLPVGRSLYVIGASARAATLLGIRTERHIPAPSSPRDCSAGSPGSCSAASWRQARPRSAPNTCCRPSPPPCSARPQSTRAGSTCPAPCWQFSSSPSRFPASSSSARPSTYSISSMAAS